MQHYFQDETAISRIFILDKDVQSYLLKGTSSDSESTMYTLAFRTLWLGFPRGEMYTDAFGLLGVVYMRVCREDVGRYTRPVVEGCATVGLSTYTTLGGGPIIGVCTT